MYQRICFLILVAVALPCCESTGLSIGSDGSPEATPWQDQVTMDIPADIAPEMVPAEVFDVVEVWTLDLVDTEDGDTPWQAGPGEAGYPCESASQCNEGFCIQTADGKQCTVTCQEECPFDWQCLLHNPSLPDQIYVCVPAFVDLCRPCANNSDCWANGVDGGQSCVSYGAEGLFCGSSCAANEDCPADYACVEATDASGAQVTRCKRTLGECQCEQWYVDQGASTFCFVENEWGLCTGERACKSLGLTGCDAPVPDAELCNGQDDDCDGDVDEDTSGLPCLVISPFGACPGEETCIAGMISCDGPEPLKEICDGADNDCDGEIDEGYLDTDQDGVADCLENDVDGDGIADLLDNCPAAFNPGQADFDLDNFGDACDLDDDNDMTPDGTDCAPFDAKTNPQAEEVCDGADNNCNFLVDEGFQDSDADGWKNCVDEDDDGDGSADEEDCQPLNPLIHPGVVEACDGVDNNCNGAVDEDFPDLDEDGEADCVDLDTDNDGTPDTDDCAPSDPAIHPDADELCDGTDNDCDYIVDEGFADYDGDGFKNCIDLDDDEDGDPDESDCLPLDPKVHQNAAELCNNADDNCNGEVDEGLGTVTCGLGECEHSIDACAAGLWQVCNPFTGSAPEICDAQDNDCDGLVDEDLGSTLCGKGICLHKMNNCEDGVEPVCDPGEGAEDEVCDGLDNNCDGSVDEDLGSLACGKGACFHTLAACIGGASQVCNAFEGASPEVCDGVDNDCDGEVDEGLGVTTCGQGECAHEQPYCEAGMVNVCDPFQGAAEELCDGQDNDCNGLTDEGLGKITCGMGACEHSVDKCIEGEIQDCDPLEGQADEICDGVDNNCDGVVDPENTVGCKSFYLDTDADGWGADDSLKCLCAATPLYSTEKGGDCSDLDQNVNPGEEEDCDTELDEDCSGQVNDGCTYLSCKSLLAGNPDAQSGIWSLDPDGEGGTDPFDAYCDMETDGGGWTLIAKVSGADGKHWGCGSSSACSGSLWRNSDLYNSTSQFAANEDAKFPAYLHIKGTDIMFYDVVHDYPLLYANDMYSARTLGAQIGQLQDKGACTCCSEEYPAAYVKTGVAHLFCKGADCNSNPRIGFWCRDEEGWGTRDFNLITMPNDANFGYNFGNKPGLASDRLDPGHSGGSSVDADAELNNSTGDARRWPFAAAILLR